MPFIDMAGLNEAKEPVLAPDGEYTVIITGANYKEETSLIVVMCEIEAADPDVEYATLFHNISLPKSGDEKKSLDFKCLLASRFRAQFDLGDAEGFDTEAMVGARSDNVKIKQKEWDNRFSNEMVLDNLAA